MSDETAQLTADVVLFADVRGRRHVLVIRRGKGPLEGLWALPGGHVDASEPVEQAARRELLEETGVQAEVLELVGVYAAAGLAFDHGQILRDATRGEREIVDCACCLGDLCDICECCHDCHGPGALCPYDERPRGSVPL